MAEVAFTRVLEGLEAGLSLRKVCKRKGSAGVKAVLSRVIREPDGFGARYAQARHVGLLQMEEQMLQMVDDIGLSETDAKLANAEVQKVRLQIETRKWLMSKMRPDVYGDRVAIGGDSRGAPIRISDEAAAREVALLLASAAVRMKAAAVQAGELETNRLN